MFGQVSVPMVGFVPSVYRSPDRNAGTSAFGGHAIFRPARSCVCAATPRGPRSVQEFARLDLVGGPDHASSWRWAPTSTSAPSPSRRPGRRANRRKRGPAPAYADRPSYLCMALEEGGGAGRRDFRIAVVAGPLVGVRIAPIHARNKRTRLMRIGTAASALSMVKLGPVDGRVRWWIPSETGLDGAAAAFSPKRQASATSTVTAPERGRGTPLSYEPPPAAN